MLECNVCGEEAKPWKDLRRGENGWCCTSTNCIAGGRSTRYTAEWLREKIGKKWPGKEDEIAFSVFMILMAIVIAVGLHACIVAVRTPDPVKVVEYKPIEQPCSIEGRDGRICLIDNRSGNDVIVGCDREVKDANADLFVIADKIGCEFQRRDGGK